MHVAYAPMSLEFRRLWERPMDFKRFNLSIAFIAALLLFAFCLNGTAQAQVRVKRPDRGSYQPPVVQKWYPVRKTPESAPESVVESRVERASYQVPAELQDVQDAQVKLRTAPKRKTKPAQTQPKPRTITHKQTGHKQTAHKQTTHRQVGHKKTTHKKTGHNKTAHKRTANQNNVRQAGAEIIHGDVIHDTFPIDSDGVIDGGCSCPNCVGEVACDAGSCDSLSCDSIGCDSKCRLSLPSKNAFISLDRCDWFGSVELLLMFRRGDRLPALVTTGPDGDVDTAGELNQIGTEILVGGGESIFDDVTAGARFQLGTWLDSQQARSLVLRGWFAGEETFGFSQDQESLPVIARPFLNVSDGQAAEQDTQVIAFPGQASGQISISGDSNVYGGDLSIRQLLWGHSQFAVDVFYGYQFMRFDENLSINTNSVSLIDDFAPLGSVLSVSDSFDIENEFHGGQLGLSSFGRWGCWSFSSLAKVGFGSLRRSADLQGETITSNGGVTAVDPNGLLVRSSNSGRSSDSTFGWVPELDFTLGWRRFPHFDVTIGYHVIALSDALQVSGAIDEDLASNLAVPQTGQIAPSADFRFDTFYIQGIHFGLSYVY